MRSSLLTIVSVNNNLHWDFPGSPVVKVPHTSNGGDTGSIPGRGTKIPHAAGHSQKIYIYIIYIVVGTMVKSRSLELIHLT